HTPPIQSALTEEETRGRSRTREKSPKQTLSMASTEIIDDDDDDVPGSKKGKSPVRSRKDTSARLKETKKLPSSSRTCDEEPPRGRTQVRSTPAREKSPRFDSHSDRSRNHSPDARKDRRKPRSPDRRKYREKSHSLSPDLQKSHRKSPDHKIVRRKSRSLSPSGSGSPDGQKSCQPPASNCKVTCRKSRSLSPLGSGSPDGRKSRQPPASDRKVTRQKSRSLSPSGSGSSRSSDPRRSHSQLPNRSLHSIDPRDIPKPPKGWMDKDYYDVMYTSYVKGDKPGRGGRNFREINGVGTKEVRLSFLEKLGSLEMQYAFVDKYGHPFARKLGIPHFNPYGYVPRDPKVVAQIERPKGDDWQLYIEMGTIGDYDLYLNALSIIRSLVLELKPDDSILKPGKTAVTWSDYSQDLHKKLCRKAIMALPWLWHYRDETGKYCWVVFEIARKYLSGSKSYDPKRKHIQDTTKCIRQNATRVAENAMKNYPVPAKEDDPYYIMAAAGNLDVASHKGRTPLSKLRSNATLDTTSKRDARRADKIVAEEEVHEKEASKASSSKTQPVKPPKASASEAVKLSKADTLEIKSGKVFKAVGPKANSKDKASNSAKKVTHIESDEDSEEELLAETHKLLAAPSVPPPTASPSKSPRMQVEVVLKSPAPAKPKV
ncbi:hypothetical protein FRC11_014493, partial [Ceratobasidium sp. 423]